MTFPNSEQAEAIRIALDMACKEFGLREADEAVAHASPRRSPRLPRAGQENGSK